MINYFSDTDPFGITSSTANDITTTGIKIYKTMIKKKRRTMASIYQFKALSDFTNLKKPESFDSLENVDKKLHDKGVRPGQIWDINYGSTRYFLAFIGYHEKGFIALNLRSEEESPVPSVSLFKYPRKIKMVLLENIEDGTAKMLSTVTPDLVDLSGEALPSREIDVAFSSLLVQPGYWHNQDNNKNYFISLCEKGHYRVSQDFLPSGERCDQFCFNPTSSDHMKSFIDLLLTKIFLGSEQKRRYIFRRSESTQFSTSILHVSASETTYDSNKIIESNVLGIRRDKHKPEEIRKENDWILKTEEWFKRNNLRSGQIFNLKSNNNRSGAFPEEMQIRFHLRKCGYLHAEISKDMTFNDKQDKFLLKSFCEGEYKALYNKNESILFDKRMPAMKCPICNSLEPVICIENSRLKETFKNKSNPVVPKKIASVEILAAGDIIKFKGKPALFLKEVSTYSGKSTLVLQDHKLKSQTNKKISVLKDHNKELFLDNNNFMKRKIKSIHSWHKLVMPGTKLEINPSTPNKNLQEVKSNILTCISYPFISADQSCVYIIESDSIVYLNRDVLLPDAPYIEKGMSFKMKDNIYSISRIDNAEVIVKQGETLENIPLISMQLGISRGDVNIIKQDTVESIMQNL